MPAAFDRSADALTVQSLKMGRVVGLLFLLMAAWGSWLWFARVSVFQATARARVEVQSAAHPLAVEVTGRVTRTYLAIGRRVEAGEVLVVLDSAAEEQAREEARVRRETYIAGRQAIMEEIVAEEESLRLAKNARDAALSESNERVREAEVRAKLAAQEEQIASQLRSKQAVSEMEYQRNAADRDARKAVVAGLEAAETRLDQDWALEAQERRVRLAKLRREATAMQGAADLEQAVMARLEHAIAQRTVRAPIAGQLGDIADVQVGTVVSAAQKLGTVIPVDQPHAVAFFSAASVGRVKTNQPARLRFDGYPWTQFGTVPAVVRRVGSEPTAGVIRVELELQPEPDCAIPLTHGLPASLEVQVEQVSPAVLLLRAAGQWVAPRSEGNRSPKSVVPTEPPNPVMQNATVSHG